MIEEFASVADGIRRLVDEWETRLQALPEAILTDRRNSQGRSIKQILGHLIDSASNNLHRVVHLQYSEEPLAFPNYSTDGNNDRWIALQSYQDEDWALIVELWRWSNLHLAHVIEHIDEAKLGARWTAELGVEVTLREMVIDYLPHLELHLRQIKELLR